TVLVIRRRRAADQRAVEGVPTLHRLVDLVGPGTVLRAVVRPAHPRTAVLAEADHVAQVRWVVPEGVVGLPLGEVEQPLRAGGVEASRVGGDEGEEGRTRGVAQGTPVEVEDLATRGVGRLLSIVAKIGRAHV